MIIAKAHTPKLWKNFVLLIWNKLILMVLIITVPMLKTSLKKLVDVMMLMCIFL